MTTATRPTDSKGAAARAFLRSLNILLKFARLYGFEHARTAAQLEAAWSELHAVLPSESETGLLLGASGSQLLLDGVPLEAAPAERSFAELLSSAGIASVQFFRDVTRDELARFVRAFPAGGARSESSAEQWKAAVAGCTGIRINEVRFVAEDSNTADTRVAAQLVAQTLGSEAGRLKQWLSDPRRLLQLIAAAEAAEAQTARSGPSGIPSGAESQSGPVSVTSHALQEEDILEILRLLIRLGEVGTRSDAGAEPHLLHEHLLKLPRSAQATLRNALSAAAVQTPSTPDEHVLVKLAEDLAIRFALDRYQRGEVRVNAVRQMLDRMSREIQTLRRILGTHEEKMARAGIRVESHAEILDRQFWAAAPEAGKRSVLLSPDAWCIPARNIRQYVEELRGRGESELAREVLQKYASGVTHPEAEARRKTALGLCEIAELYAEPDGRLLVAALRESGLQTSLEPDAELQNLVSAAFVRLSQEAITRRCYPAIQQSLASFDAVESQRPSFAQNLRPRIAVNNRIPEFIEAALRTEHIPDGLADLLRLMPRPAMTHLLARFNRCGFREDRERVLEVARKLDSEGVCYLRELLRAGPAAEAAETAGMLSRLDPYALQQLLPGRLREWPRSSNDRVVRTLLTGGAPERGRVLLLMLDRLDPLVVALAIEEMGMSGDPWIGGRLIELAENQLPEFATPYSRLKAIEALGRLHAQEAIPVLRKILEARHAWRWAHPSELRIAAAQALQKIDPLWTRDFLPRSGLHLEELSLALREPLPDSPWVRQRRFTRLRLAQPVPAVTTNLRENCRMEIRIMNMDGGLAIAERHLAPGLFVSLRIGVGLRSVRAQVFVRDSRTQAMGFEIADIDLEERARLRHLLLSAGIVIAEPKGAPPRRAGEPLPSALN